MSIIIIHTDSETESWLPTEQSDSFVSIDFKKDGQQSSSFLIKKSNRKEDSLEKQSSPLAVTDSTTKGKRSGKRSSTFLVKETKRMERMRRLYEQECERTLAQVKAREHSTEEVSHQPEGELQNSILQHPYLNTQRFDGTDSSLNPEPALNTEARREYDNQKREQEREKQLRLNLELSPTHGHSSTPTPTLG